MKTLGVILAGGLATRMGGGDKSLLPLNGEPLMKHVLSRLDPQVDAVIINANGDPIRFSDFEVPVVADSIEGFLGPLVGVLAGMDYAATRGFDRVLVVAADTPFFPSDLAELLSQNAYDINIARDDNTVEKFALHPTFGLWNVSLRDELRAAIIDGMRKVMGFVKQHDWRAVTWKTDGYNPFFNVNTPEDMNLAKQILQELNT